MGTLPKIGYLIKLSSHLRGSQVFCEKITFTKFDCRFEAVGNVALVLAILRPFVEKSLTKCTAN